MFTWVQNSANVTHFSTSTCWQLAQVARKLGTSWNPVAAQHPLFLRQVNCSRCPSCPWCPVHCRIFEPVSICFHVQQSHSMLSNAVQCCSIFPRQRPKWSVSVSGADAFWPSWSGLSRSTSFPAMRLRNRKERPQKTAAVQRMWWSAMAVPHRHRHGPHQIHQEGSALLLEKFGKAKPTWIQKQSSPLSTCHINMCYLNMSPLIASVVECFNTSQQIPPDEAATFAKRSQCLFTQLWTSSTKDSSATRPIGQNSTENSKQIKDVPRRSTVCASWSSSAKALKFGPKNHKQHAGSISSAVHAVAGDKSLERNITGSVWERASTSKRKVRHLPCNSAALLWCFACKFTLPTLWFPSKSTVKEANSIQSGEISPKPKALCKSVEEL